MYCVSYRFQLLSNNSETRRQFIAVWSGIMAFFRNACGASGARLHYGEEGAFYAYVEWPGQAVMAAAQEVEVTPEFLALRVKWAELCAPSEVLWEGEVLVDMSVVE